jgi:1-acyl-sn-glycerol-3-phosphate acyltransferase
MKLSRWRIALSFIMSFDRMHHESNESSFLQGNHILIDREDRRSQLRTFKEAIGWLKKGIPIMAFPEGTRSPDGRLLDFKGGLFSMAKKTNVPIVPISISHAHAIYPGNSLFPVQRGKGKLHVHIHDPIDTTDKTEAELGELVRKSLLSELPFDQHPIVIEQDVTLDSHAANTDTETTSGDGVQAHAEIVIPMDIPAMKQPTAAAPLEPEQA